MGWLQKELPSPVKRSVLSFR